MVPIRIFEEYALSIAFINIDFIRWKMFIETLKMRKKRCLEYFLMSGERKLRFSLRRSFKKLQLSDIEDEVMNNF